MILKAEREGPDQTAQMHSLIRAFAVRICPDGTFSHGVAVDTGLLQYLYWYNYQSCYIKNILQEHSIVFKGALEVTDIFPCDCDQLVIQSVWAVSSAVHIPSSKALQDILI